MSAPRAVRFRKKSPLRPIDIQQPDDPVRVAALRQEKPIRDRVRDALLAFAAFGILDRLVVLVRGGNILAVLQVLPFEDLKNNLTSALDPATEGFTQAARATFDRVEPGAATFDPLHQATVDAIRTYRDETVAQLVRDTQESITAAYERGIASGSAPEEIAREIVSTLGLTKRQSQAVESYRLVLENLQADALQRALRNPAFDQTVAEAIARQKPLTQAQIDRMVAAYARRQLANRAETIARTEASRAANLGAEEAWSQLVRRGVVSAEQVGQFWQTAEDEIVCPVCSSIPFLNPDGVDFGEPFDSINGPVSGAPVHPRCRCSVDRRIRRHDA